jgi:thymidylate synthase
MTTDDDVCTTIDEMWTKILRRLVEDAPQVGSRDGASRELVGYRGVLDSLNDTFLQNPSRNLDPRYAGAELLWYLTGESRVAMMQSYAPSYARFAENDGIAHGGYGTRIRGTTEMRASGLEGQLQGIVEVLKNHPESRQAVMAMWRDTDLPHAVTLDKKDVPCTLTLQFLLRDRRLHLVVNMRSNDVWMGMPYDVWCFTAMQRLVAAAVDARPGQYVHCVGSMHVYDRNVEKAWEALARVDDGYKMLDVGRKWTWSTSPPRSVFSEIRRAVDIERRYREGSDSGADVALAHESIGFFEGCSVLTDATACAVDKFVIGFGQDNVKSPALLAALERRAR